MNDYFTTNQGSFTVRTLALTKTLVSTSEAHTTGANVAIGEIVRYRLTTTMPEGTVDLRLLDALPAGFALVDPAQVKVSFVTNNDMTEEADMAGADNDADPPTFTLPASRISTEGAYTVFDLGTLTNNDSDGGAETLILEFNALVLNDAANTAGATKDNTFLAEQSGVQGTPSAPVTVTIVEPSLTIGKTPDDATGDAGDTVTFTVVVAHPGGANTAPALDAVWTDVIPAGMTYVAGSLNVAGAAPTGTNDSDPAGAGLTVNWAALQPGESSTITFNVTLDYALEPGQIVTNTGRVVWTSLPGTGTAGNPTGSITPGASGAANGERDGSGGVNTYSATDTGSATVISPAPVKSIVSTSEAHTSTAVPEPVAVGEILRYRLSISLPEGTSTNVQLADTLSNGVALVDNTQVKVSFLAENNVTESADLAGADNDANPPSFTLPASRISVAGNGVTFNLGTLVNNDGDADPEYIIIAFNALIENSAANNMNDVKANLFNVFINGTDRGASNTVNAIIVEPVLTITKDAAPLSGDGGDVITFTVTVAHDPASTAPAYEVAIRDTLPAGMAWVGNVTALAGPAPSVDTTNLPTVVFSWADLPLAASTSFSFQVRLDPNVSPGTTFVNTAALTWTSLPGAGTASNPTGSTTPGGSGATNGERDGSGGVNDYTASDGAMVTVPDVLHTKTDALQTDLDGDGTADPGDTIRYTIVITNNTGVAINNAAFTDTPDPNTTLVVGTVSTSAGSVITGNTTGDTSVAVNLGTFSAGATVTISFDVLVDFPLPNSITGVANQGYLDGDEIPAIPSDDSDTPARDDATATPITGEPLVEADKVDALFDDANGDGVANSGDTLEYTITIRNTGGRDAENVVFTDTPDANTTLEAGSVTTTQGTVVTGNGAGDASVTVNVGTIPGATGAVTITFRVLINTPLVPPTTIQVANQGTITGTNFPDEPTDDTATSTDDDPTITPLILAPLVEAAKTDALLVDGNGLADPGETLRYTVTITALGGVAAANVTFTDTPDANTTLVVGSVTTTAGAITLGNTAGDSSVAVAVGSLAAGGSVTITFDVTINDPLPQGTTHVANQGLVTGDNFSDEPTDDSDTPADDDETVTPIGQAALLSATKVDALVVDNNGNGVVNPGDTLEYTIVITNGGNADAANVIFTDTPDANTTLVVGSVTTTLGTVTLGNTAGDTGVGVTIDPLPAASSATITFRVTVNRPLPQNVRQVSNQGFVNGTIPTDDSDTPEPDDSTDTPVRQSTPEFALTATKTDTLFDDTPSGDGVPTEGDVLQYTVLITNTGRETVTGVRFSDTPDPNTTLIAGSVTSTQGVIPLGNTPGDTSVQVDIGDIPAGVSVTILFNVRINSPLPPNTAYVANQGLITGTTIPDQPTDDPDQPGPDDPTITVLGNVPFIKADKTVELTGDTNGDGIVNEGETLTYTVTVSNLGNADALNIVFTDTPDPNTSLVVGSVTVSDPAALVVQDSSVQVTIPALPVGGVVEISFRVTVHSPLPDGVTEIRNQGLIQGDNVSDESTDNPDTPADDDSTDIPVDNPPDAPPPSVTVFDPAISKVGILEEGALGLPGEKLTWEFTISNVGSGAGTNIVITDTIAPELRVDGAAIDVGTASINGQTVTFTIPVLHPGQMIKAYIYTTVLESPLDVENIALLEGSGRTATATAHVKGEDITSLPSTGYAPQEEIPSRPLTGWLIVGMVAVGLVVTTVFGAMRRLRR